MRAILLPLTVNQFHSMQKMQRLQPQLKAIQSEVQGGQAAPAAGDDEVLQGDEINPLGSCLPLVVQLPVFISLFYMLRQDLRKNICPTTQAH